MKNSKIRNSLIINFSFFVLIFLLASCGKGEVKKVSEDSKIALEAFKLAEVVRNAYTKNDRITMERNSTKEGYREIIGAAESFDSVELTFVPKRVDIEDSTVTLDLSWNSVWIVSGKRIEDRGVATFVMEGRPLKLDRVLRSNPFRQPE
jgi:hypothetical protein